MRAMRRLQIYLDEGLDEALEREAKRRGASKASIVRAAVAREVDGAQPQPRAADPWAGLIGLFEGGQPVDDIDAVIYEEGA